MGDSDSEHVNIVAEEEPDALENFIPIDYENGDNITQIHCSNIFDFLEMFHLLSNLEYLNISHIVLVIHRGIGGTEFEQFEQFLNILDGIVLRRDFPAKEPPEPDVHPYHPLPELKPEPCHEPPSPPPNTWPQPSESCSSTSVCSP